MMEFKQSCDVLLSFNLVLEAKSLDRSVVLAGLVPPEGHEGESVPPSLPVSGGLGVTFGLYWLVEASPRSLPAFSHAARPCVLQIILVFKRYLMTEKIFQNIVLNLKIGIQNRCMIPIL